MSDSPHEETVECPDCGNQYEKEQGIYTHWGHSDTCERPTMLDEPIERVAMFSGGHDSLVSTHYCMENGITDAVLHIDTGTGIDENLEFVKDTCERYGWDLYVRSPKKSLEEFSKEWGFPKASSHSWAYRYFKDHPLSSFVHDIPGDHTPAFYTGVRKDESARRMENVTTERQEDASGNWVWVAPIADWTKADCEAYIDEHDLPRNPVVDNIHRSGECFCGAFAHRDEELIDLLAYYPDHAEWIFNVEERVQTEIGMDEDYCWWGGDGSSSDDILCAMEEDKEKTMMLCRDCEYGTVPDEIEQ